LNNIKFEIEEGLLISHQLLMIGHFICQCKERGNIQDGIELPFELVPCSFPLPCFLLLGYCFQLQEGMILEKDVVVN
jgi:hypothetical protein